MRFISTAYTVRNYLKTLGPEEVGETSADWVRLSAIYDVITRGFGDESRSQINSQSLMLRRQLADLSFEQAVEEYCILAERLCGEKK